MEKKEDSLLHPDSEKLPHFNDIQYTSDLVCPFMSNSESLVKCLGRNCANFDNCYKENNYFKILSKGFVALFVILQMLIFIAIIFK